MSDEVQTNEKIVIQCEKGHYYDSAIYSVCPHCHPKPLLELSNAEVFALCVDKDEMQTINKACVLFLSSSSESGKYSVSYKEIYNGSVNGLSVCRYSDNLIVVNIVCLLSRLEERLMENKGIKWINVKKGRMYYSSTSDISILNGWAFIVSDKDIVAEDYFDCNSNRNKTDKKTLSIFDAADIIKKD